MVVPISGAFFSEHSERGKWTSGATNLIEPPVFGRGAGQQGEIRRKGFNTHVMGGLVLGYSTLYH